MVNITVCARFRPLSSKERSDHGDVSCIESLDTETFVFKDEKEGATQFSFDQVFYENSEQFDVYQFLAQPIVQGWTEMRRKANEVALKTVSSQKIERHQNSVNGINGTIITYGQTGAGKTYSMEGPGILECDVQKKGLLPRVVDGLFKCIKLSDKSIKYTVKLSMVEIYMEKVRDLFDLSKDNIQIKESKQQGIFLYGATEISISDSTEALQSLSSGISNRAVGETQMNMASSRSHCVYLFTIQQELTMENRIKSGKLILVDLAGSEKVEKTGAEGKILEEAKTINKSLSALGNVINALTCSPLSKPNHIPYRDSKLTRILQDALGGNSRTALLCCCSPSPLNASESLSTLRFGTRARHIKASPRPNCSKEKCNTRNVAASPTQDGSRERILSKLSERLDAEDVRLLEELFILDGIFDYPDTVEELELSYEDATTETISLLQRDVEELRCIVEELKTENLALKARLVATNKMDSLGVKTEGENQILGIIDSFIAWFRWK